MTGRNEVISFPSLQPCTRSRRRTVRRSFSLRDFFLNLFIFFTPSCRIWLCTPHPDYNMLVMDISSCVLYRIPSSPLTLSLDVCTKLSTRIQESRFSQLVSSLRKRPPKMCPSFPFICDLSRVPLSGVTLFVLLQMEKRRRMISKSQGGKSNRHVLNRADRTHK